MPHNETEKVSLVTWQPFLRCAFCDCEILVDAHGIAITCVTGTQHFCGKNCACAHEARTETGEDVL